MMTTYFFVLLFILPSHAFKFLMYEPIFGYSHTKFMGSIADALTEAGHDVTILMSVLDQDQEKLADPSLTKNLIKVGPDPRTAEIIRHKGEKMSKMWTMQPTPLDWLRNIVPILSSQFAFQCEKVISDDTLMQELKSMKFDAGIAETFTICGFGIFEVLNLPATIATFSRVHSDYVRSAIGEPSGVSYVPGMC
ncbi:unnamed protein product [Cylicocyclus nassatus]|uniref:glucuronosyltransferase n=1 Tax=Cylicocyclus nassatus TaxID=53992 RepID=A0AA36H651_CYLNA|nr:unnamed protein product [Cylicocyclus nassatus]